MRMNGIQNHPASAMFLVAPIAPMVMTIGTRIWATATPMLPPAALSPSATPFSRCGKKKLMFDIELAKFPPPKPARAATNSMTGNGVSGLLTANPSATAGISSRAAEIIVQLRPPSLGTRKVYGRRRVAPTSAGIEMSQKVWLMSKVKPAAGSCTTTMLQSCQTTKPRNSAKIDHLRLRLAMARPTRFHWPVSSAFQPSIHRPGRCVSVDASFVVSAVGLPGAVSVISVLPSCRRIRDRRYAAIVSPLEAIDDGRVTNFSLRAVSPVRASWTSRRYSFASRLRRAAALTCCTTTNTRASRNTADAITLASGGNPRAAAV